MESVRNAEGATLEKIEQWPAQGITSQIAGACDTESLEQVEPSKDVILVGLVANSADHCSQDCRKDAYQICALCGYGQTAAACDECGRRCCAWCVITRAKVQCWYCKGFSRAAVFWNDHITSIPLRWRWTVRNMIDKTKCNVKTLDMWESMVSNASHRSPYNDWIVGEWKLGAKDRIPWRRMLTARVFYSGARGTRRNVFHVPRAAQHVERVVEVP